MARRIMRAAVSPFDFAARLRYNELSVGKHAVRLPNHPNSHSTEASMPMKPMHAFIWVFSLLLCSPGIAEKPKKGPHDFPGTVQTQVQGKVRGKVDGSVLAENAYCVLKARCTECHDNGQKRGDLGNILTRAVLLAPGKKGQKWVVPGNADESSLYVRMRAAEMPPEPPDTQDSETAAIAAWIRAGAPEFPPGTQCAGTAPVRQKVDALPQQQQGAVKGKRVITPEIVINSVFKDMVKNRIDPRNNPYVYFSLAHLRNSGKERDKQVYKDALATMTNLTSRGAAMVIPDVVDETGGLLYRVDTRLTYWPREAIGLLKANDPYFKREVLKSRGMLPFGTADEIYIESAIASTMPLDYFVSRAGDWDAYQALLQLPNTQTEMLNGNKPEILLTAKFRGQSNLAAHKYFIPNSRADKNQTNREAQFLELPRTALRPTAPPFSHVIISNNYDPPGNPLAPKALDQDAAARPLAGILGVDDNLRSKPVSQDGIGLLPNGMPAFFRHDAKGNTDAEIIGNGPRFCFSCHLPEGSLFQFKDRSELVERQLRARGVSPAVIAGAAQIFPGEQQREKDFAIFRDRFAAGIAQLNLAPEEKKDPDVKGAKFENRENGDFAVPRYSNFGGSHALLIGNNFRNPLSVRQVASIVGTNEQVLRALINQDPQISLRMVNPDEFSKSDIGTTLNLLMQRVPSADRALRRENSSYLSR